MRHRVIVEAWKHDSSHVHIHEPARVGDGTCASSLALEITVARAVRLGRISKLLIAEDGIFYIEWPNCDCLRFCEMLTEVAQYTATRIAEAQDQLADINPLCDALSTDEIAFVIWKCCQIWEEQGAQVENPFLPEQSLDYPIEEVLQEYLGTQSRAMA